MVDQSMIRIAKFSYVKVNGTWLRLFKIYIIIYICMLV